MTCLLTGLRVLELGQGHATAFCGKLLAEAGLDVVLAEPPDGHPLRHEGDGADFLYLAGGKRSIAWAETDRAALLAGADLVLHDLTDRAAVAQGLDFSGLQRIRPGLVVTAITPYGSSGPHADDPASDLTVYARAGHLFLTGQPGRAPVLPYGRQPALFAGLVAAHASLAALLQARRDGTGRFVEIAAAEALTGALDTTLSRLNYVGVARGRTGNRLADGAPLTEIYPTRDGFFVICVYTEPQWRGFCEMMERPDWLADPALQGTSARAAAGAVLEPAIRAWFAERTSQEALALCQRFRLPACIVASVAELLADPQLAARAHFAEIPGPGGEMLRTPRLPYVSSRGESREGAAPGRAGDAAAIRADWTPRQGVQGESSALPLAGFRVLDVTHAWAGPFAGLQLGFLGADMIKVEGARRPDGTRYVSADARNLTPRHETGGYYHEWNRNKRSAVINMDAPEGRALMRALVAKSDVLINNHSARVLPKWGLDWPALQACNPRLILVTMPAFGSQGPYRDFVGYGETLEGAGGLQRLTGYGPGQPLRSGVAYPDPLVGHFGALAVTLGLLHREQTGTGLWLDVSHQECVLHLIGGAVLRYQLTGQSEEPCGNARPGLLFNDVLPCRGEDEWIAVTTATPAQWQALVAQAGLPNLASGPDASLALAEWTSWQDKHSLAASLLATGVPAGAVLKPREIAGDPQLVARNFFERVAHPVVGEKPHARAGFSLHGSTVGTRQAAPLFDSSTDEILRDLLGKTADEITALRAAGVIGGTPAGSLLSP